QNNRVGTTYGSVDRAQEVGGGAGNGGSGGGIVRVIAGTVVVDGAIRANGWLTGGYNDRGGAGGSVWVSAGTVGGAGAIEARGGDGAYWGTGGGGAIAVEYTTGSSGTLLANLLARPGTPSSQRRYGGAGKVGAEGRSS